MAKRSIYSKPSEQLSIREQLGISQEEYALFCGVSKSMLSMIEINQRSWPLGKANQNGMLIDFYEAQKNPPDQSALVKAEPWEVKEYQVKLLKLKIELYKVENQLEEMEFKTNAAAKRLKTCLKLRERFPQSESMESKLLNVWEQTAKTDLRKNRPIDQQLVRLKLENLNAQKLLVENWLVVNGS